MAVIDWVQTAAAAAGVDLRPLKGTFHGDKQVVDRAYRALDQADLVVAIAGEAEASAHFEAGYALGIGKPLLYVARASDSVPFNTRGVESFVYREADGATGQALSRAMGRRVAIPRTRVAVARDVTFLRTQCR